MMGGPLSKVHRELSATRPTNPAVYSTIVGIRTVEQLDALERAELLKLSSEATERLDVVLDLTTGRPFKSAPAPNACAWGGRKKKRRR